MFWVLEKVFVVINRFILGDFFLLKSLYLKWKLGIGFWGRRDFYLFIGKFF